MRMNRMMIFSNPEFGNVRTVTIDGNPWFVGIDVATALGYQNGSRDIQRHVEKEDKVQIIMNLKYFNTEEKVIKSRLLLYTISRLLGTTKGIEKIHIEDIIKLCEKNIGNKYLTPNKNIKILVKNQKIYFINQNLT